MSRVPSDERVRSFWAWFEQVAPTLASQLDEQEAIAELDRRVSDLGDFAWEVGPGFSARHMLAISPDGEVDLLEVTRAIVAMAPNMSGWEFYSSRQPRPLTAFTLERVGGQRVQVDPRTWRYVLFRHPDGVFDLVVEMADLAEASDEEKYSAAVVFADASLGEGVRLRLIREIEPVSALPPDMARRANSASHLAAHLASLASANFRAN